MDIVFEQHVKYEFYRKFGFLIIDFPPVFVNLSSITIGLTRNNQILFTVTDIKVK